MTRRAILATAVAAGLFACALTPGVGAHGRDARYVEAVAWPATGTVARVFAASRSELGTPGARRRVEMQQVDGRTCAVAGLLAVDVNDRFAFDIDEAVDVTVTYAAALTDAPFTLGWDQNAGNGYSITPDVMPEAGAGLKTVTLTLDRARFAGQGVLGADFAVAARNNGAIALCGIDVKRSGLTPAPAASGKLRLSVTDGNGGPNVAARVGLYDGTGRTPLPTDKAVPVHRFADEARLHYLNVKTFWPSASRLAFYVTGTYEADVPAGTYDLIVTRGPEYRVFRQKVEVRAGQTNSVAAALQRYANLPAEGWYSADSHVHLMRDEAADTQILTQMMAEDVHLANLLEMGNIKGTYYKQPAWGRAGRFERGAYALVAGQEDPRTVMRGHTIHWDVAAHAHSPESAFFHYDRTFTTTRGGGALTGYAHLGELFNGRRGLALDVPFGLVDFLEVLQGGRLSTDPWYNLLNLGYRILPVGGADYPYFGPTLPGVERMFVKVAGAFSIDAWYAGFRRGHTYVSNGPLLDFTINGRQMGEVIRVRRGETLDIAAAARLNPDVDALNRLELIVLGDVAREVAAGGRDRVELKTTMTAERSMWIAVRAYGNQAQPQFTTVAHSAPIQVIVDGAPAWKAGAVADLVKIQRAQLNELLTVAIQPNGDLESWETADTLVNEWPKQREELRPRIAEADRRYQELLDRLNPASAGPTQ
jgi:hypothetical protein